MKDAAEFLHWFRTSAPYIHAHRGKTFVVCFSGEALQSEGLNELTEDLALMHSLGIRLVLVAGARTQIDRRLEGAGRKPEFIDGVRVTSRDDLPFIRQAVGANRIELEARLSRGLPNSAMAGARLRVVSGNFVTAQPIGVVDGVDFGFSGRVRRIDKDALSELVRAGIIPIITPIAHTLSGEVYNVSAHDIASQTAIALKADKIICLSESETEDADWMQDMSVSESWARVQDARGRASRELQAVALACEGGVARGHLIPRDVDGGLLRELFTREGVGVMILPDRDEGVRAAVPDDVSSMMALLAPLERTGQLLPRNRSSIEANIEDFVVIERASTIVGCAALHRFSDGSAELACVAVHPDFRASGRGDALLSVLEQKAKEQGCDRLFALSTQTIQWFVERGFSEVSKDELPKERIVDEARGSFVLLKRL